MQFELFKKRSRIYSIIKKRVEFVLIFIIPLFKSDRS